MGYPFWTQEPILAGVGWMEPLLSPVVCSGGARFMHVLAIV